MAEHPTALLASGAIVAAFGRSARPQPGVICILTRSKVRAEAMAVLRLGGSVAARDAGGRWHEVRYLHLRFEQSLWMDGGGNFLAVEVSGSGEVTSVRGIA